MVTRPRDIENTSRTQNIERLYYRPASAAVAMDLSKQAIMHALWSGELKGYRVGKTGKAWIIPVDALHEWARSRDQAA